jgi:hypothetical protein
MWQLLLMFTSKRRSSMRSGVFCTKDGVALVKHPAHSNSALATATDGLQQGRFGTYM